MSTAAALAALPPTLATLCSSHIKQFRDDASDIIAEAFIALATAKRDDSIETIFARARSACRRAKQNPARWVPLELANEVAVDEDEFFHSRVVNDLAAFRQQSDVIVANRITDDIRDVQDKVFCRDLFGSD